jgi:K(+)-stimulated pyrophosphate-energized sodium pump
MATWIPLAVAGAAALCLALAGVMAKLLASAETGDESVRQASKSLHAAARTYVVRTYSFAGLFAAAVFVLVAVALLSERGWEAGLCFVLGALCSLGAGLVVMAVESGANGRTAEAAKGGKPGALKMAFRGSGVAGLAVAGLSLLGLSICFIIFQVVLGVWDSTTIVLGFALGASSGALFLTIGGGIFSSGAEAGADLAGSDDASGKEALEAASAGRTIVAVAGRSADLFESYTCAVIAPLLVAASGTVFQKLGFTGTVLPLALAGAGIICSAAGIMLLRSREGRAWRDPLLLSTYGAVIVAIVASFFIVWGVTGWKHIGLFYSVLVGLLAGVCIAMVGQYYTSERNQPAKDVAETAEAGPRFLLMRGLSDGMISTLVPIVAVIIALGVSFWTANRALGGSGIFGISLAALGTLTGAGMIVAINSFRPVLAGADDVARAAGMDSEVLSTAAELEDEAGTTAASGRAYTVACAGLAAIALFAAFIYSSGAGTAGLLGDYKFFAALLGGAMLAFVFAALALDGTGRTALAIVTRAAGKDKEPAAGSSDDEVEAEKTDGDEPKTSEPDKSPGGPAFLMARAAAYETVIPAVLVIVVPILVGRFAGRQALTGLLAGALAAGFMLAIFMSNASGVWSAARRKLSGDDAGASELSLLSKAGGPLMESAAPTLDIMIKAMIVVSLVFIPLFTK